MIHVCFTDGTIALFEECEFVWADIRSDPFPAAELLESNWAREIIRADGVAGPKRISHVRRVAWPEASQHPIRT